MHFMRTTRMSRYAVLFAFSGALTELAGAQAVVAAWGNVEGLRVEGEVFPFEISLCTTNALGVIGRTAKERQQPHFSRAGTVRTIDTRLGAFSIAETMQDVGPREAKLEIRLTSDSATDTGGFSAWAYREHRMTRFE